MAAGGPLNVGFPLLARAHHWGVGGYGLLFGGLGVGMLLGGLLMGAGLKLPRPGLSMAAIACAIGLLMAPLGLVGSLALAMVISAAMGVLISVVNVSINTVIQTKAAAHLMGRLFSVLVFSSLSLTPAAYAVSGGIAHAIGAGGLFLVGAALVVVAALVSLTSPAIRAERISSAPASG
jgi:hypothetical protein